MRISDWSSDVCSSDLPREIGALHFLVGKRLPVGHGRFVGHLHFVPPRRRGSRVTNVSLCDSRLLPSQEHRLGTIISRSTKLRLALLEKGHPAFVRILRSARDPLVLRLTPHRGRIAVLEPLLHLLPK